MSILLASGGQGYRSRPTDDGATIRRRRESLGCQKRYTTYEKVEYMPLMVIKKDKSRQPYSREKLMNGILWACEAPGFHTKS